MNQSIMWRAQDKNFIDLNIIDLRQFGDGLRKNVDDRPYGGGAGMILRIDIIDACLKSIKAKPGSKNQKIILTSAGGVKFTQEKAYKYSKFKRMIILCGHYEGVDNRVAENLVDEVVSIGDYVLTGGEIPAMVIADTVTRLIPDVIKPDSLIEESFSGMESEYPQYTSPEVYRGWKVAKVLLSGNHAEIDKWRKNNT